jgi:hypothetical protein
MKKLLLGCCLLLAGCDRDWKVSLGPSKETVQEYVYRDRCHIHPEVLGLQLLGYFEGQEAYNYLSPINIRRDKAGEKPVNLKAFNLWVNMDKIVAVIEDDCRLIEIDFNHAMVALRKG